MENKNFDKEYLTDELENPREKKIILIASIIGGVLVLATLFYSIRL